MIYFEDCIHQTELEKEEESQKQHVDVRSHIDRGNICRKRVATHYTFLHGFFILYWLFHLIYILTILTLLTSDE